MIRYKLLVQTHHCRCGNSWTSSYVRSEHGAGLNGGPPTLLAHSIYPTHIACFACVDPTLPEWTTGEARTASQNREPKAPLDLLE